MIELSIRFIAKSEKSPITVSLLRLDAGTSTEPVRFTPPLDELQLAELRWYLELFPSWPTGPDYERAERIEAQMEDWGRALRDSIIGESKAARLWQQFVEAEAQNKLLTIDASDPRVLRLPWELLADVGGHVFSEGVRIRRRLQQEVTSASRSFSLPVRVLMVVSRPDDAGFFDPRNDALPLLDALDELGAQTEIEFLYPPTLKALTKRLRMHEAPPIHVVHFDGHGVYDVMLGLGYLLFENKEHQSDRVDANRLGTLLNRCGVPLMVLSACQSGKQEEINPYASVAARLVQTGVANVLAMNYTVLTVAARKFVEAFYGSLAAGLSVGRSVDEGRYALYSDVERHTLTRRDDKGELTEVTIRLNDWFLPALYQQAADPVVFAPATDLGGLQKTSEVLALAEPTAPGGLPPDPPHGFHGRAREMLRLERALAEKAVLVLHGFGGLGKTALAAEAGRWFHRTGRFPGGAAFVSFEGGGSLAQLCSWVGQAVSGDPDFMVHGDGPEGGRGDPVARVGALLRERPALVILDNFESVLGREPLMPAEELAAVLDAVWSWAAVGAHGRAPLRTRVLITTRDTTFTDARFKPSRHCAHIELEGLATADALALAAAVLDDHGIDRAAIDREALVDLMEHLGGHPLSLNLALPHLRQFSPAELAARFEELLPGFTAGKAVARNESLAVSLEFSLRRLGDDTRAALPGLAVFQGACFEDDMLAITGIDPALWATARAEMEAAALVSVETLPGVNPPFLRFHPTLLPYLARDLDAGRRAALEEAYWQRYYALARYLYRADTQTPHQARAVAQRELPNLRRALDLCLAGASRPDGTLHLERAEAAVDFATRIAHFLDNFGRWREREAMMAQVHERVGARLASPDAPLTKAEYLLLSQQGEALWGAGRAAEAEALFRGLLARLEAGAAYEAVYDHAYTLWMMGRCLETQWRPAQAVDWQRRALAGFEPLSASSESAKRMMAACRVDWADNLAAMGQYGEAQEHYETALPVLREVDDQRSIGATLGQLGTLALRRGDLGTAARRHTEALETFRALGEPQMEAVAWHQLGVVAQEQAGQVGAQRAAPFWDEAERCYRESLRLKESFGDLPGVARTCNQLALVAKGAGRPADAERWYLRAIEMFDTLKTGRELAAAANNLANLYLAQGRLDEAERYARRALDIDESIGDPSVEIWKDYGILAQIAEARGRPAEAARWRRKANESRDAYAGTQHHLAPILQQFQQVIAAVVAACKGDEQAKALVEGLFDTFRQGNWQIVEAIQRIWAGERDEEALTANIDYNSRAIVLAILAQLSGGPDLTGLGRTAGSPDLSGLEEPESQGLSLDDLLGLVAAATGPGAPPGLGQQLHGLTRSLAVDPRQPPEIRALGDVLHRFLSGDRDPDLSALPPDLAAAVRQRLGCS